mmetsp:Transcript_18261/g.16554  ORF Transcript_18261/g.16554 Transcript_18261/m.16554 type:complete len:152 (-) Transcript_18261:51-506(-)
MSLAEAIPVDSQIMKVSIPSGLKPGDSFIVTPKNGRVFTVIVPEGYVAGKTIEVVVPDEVIIPDDDSDDNHSSVSFKKATVGAAIVGGAIGLCLLGPIGGLCLGGGAAYLASKEKGQAGEVARKAGKTTYKKVVEASKWIDKKIGDRYNHK